MWSAIILKSVWCVLQEKKHVHFRNSCGIWKYYLSPKLQLFFTDQYWEEWVSGRAAYDMSECSSNLPSDITRLCHCQTTPVPFVAAFGSRNSPFQQDIVFQLTQDFIRDDLGHTWSIPISHCWKWFKLNVHVLVSVYWRGSTLYPIVLQWGL